MLGAGREGPVDRFLFGDIPQVVLDQSNIPVMVIRPHLNHSELFLAPALGAYLRIRRAADRSGTGRMSRVIRWAPSPARTSSSL